MAPSRGGRRCGSARSVPAAAAPCGAVSLPGRWVIGERRYAPPPEGCREEKRDGALLAACERCDPSLSAPLSLWERRLSAASRPGASRPAEAVRFVPASSPGLDSCCSLADLQRALGLPSAGRARLLAAAVALCRPSGWTAGRPAGGASGPFSVFRRRDSCVLPGFASPPRSFASLGCRAEGKLSSRKADAGSALVCERCEGRGLPGAPPAERWALASGGFVGLSFLIPPHLLLWLMRLRKRSPEFHTPSRCTFFLWLFCGSARCCVFVFQRFAAAVPDASVSLPSEG